MAEGDYDLLIIDLKMPGMDGLSVIREARRRNLDLPVIIVTGFSTEANAIEAINLGVTGYLTKPFRPAEVVLTIRKARERERLRRANQALRREVQRATGERPIVATSEAMIELLELMEESR